MITKTKKRLDLLADVHIHFADSIRSLEVLAKDAEHMFKRAEETLTQVEKAADNDEQTYCKLVFWNPNDKHS